MVHVQFIRAKVQFEYKCLECSRAQLGTTEELETTAMHDFGKWVNGRPPAHGMPVGWASYLNGFRCPEHVK